MATVLHATTCQVVYTNKITNNKFLALTTSSPFSPGGCISKAGGVPASQTSRGMPQRQSWWAGRGGGSSNTYTLAGKATGLPTYWTCLPLCRVDVMLWWLGVASSRLILSLVHVLPVNRGLPEACSADCSPLLVLWPSVGRSSAPFSQSGDFPACSPPCLVC